MCPPRPLRRVLSLLPLFERRSCKVFKRRCKLSRARVQLHRFSVANKPFAAAKAGDSFAATKINNFAATRLKCRLSLSQLGIVLVNITNGRAVSKPVQLWLLQLQVFVTAKPTKCLFVRPLKHVTSRSCRSYDSKLVAAKSAEHLQRQIRFPKLQLRLNEIVTMPAKLCAVNAGRLAATVAVTNRDEQQQQYFVAGKCPFE